MKEKALPFSPGFDHSFSLDVRHFSALQSFTLHSPGSIDHSGFVPTPT
jgi:hypothetical protein